MKNEKKLTYISRVGLMILTSVLILLFFGIMSLVGKIQGTARVVNYAGLVRGKTQRIIKLEDAGQPQDGMIADIDAFIEGLRNGSKELDLVRLNDKDFQNKMTDLAGQFEELKTEIQKVREYGYENTDIIAKSESFFNTCDEATGLAEKYSQKRASALSRLENVVIADIICLLVIIGWELVKALRYAAQNAALKKKVYLDEATGLPNKNKCEELLNQETPVSTDAPVAVCVFDLNNLRTINNNLGHDKGDAYIRSFAQQLRLAVPEEHFVGRDGGDEFLALLHGLDHKGVKDVLGKIRTQIAEYSARHPEMPISYAVGYALSTDFEGSTLRELFRLADKNMYVDKNRAKMEEAAEIQRQNYQLLDEIKIRGFQFTDCIYCDAMLDEYRVLRASSTFFLAEDGSYSGAVEQIVQELASDETRKDLWRSLQLPYLKETLSEQENKLELLYDGEEDKEEQRHGRITILFGNATEDGRLHHFLLGFEVFHDVTNAVNDEKMQLMQYYDQMKQSILENGKYVDALLETAEAVYTVNLTEDKLEAVYFHGKDHSIDVELEVPCSYNAYCQKRSEEIAEDTLENFRIVDTSEKLIGRFLDGEKQVAVEYLEKGKGGKRIWLQKTVLMTQNTWYDGAKQEAREAIHGIILFKNTSAFHEKEQLEKERLQVAFEEADSASRAKTEFMNRMSHDIRTPINGIMGMVDITRKYRNDPEKLEECLDKIQLSSRHLQELINDVLDMSKLESDQTVLEQIPFDLQRLMSEVSSLVNAQLIQGNITHRIHRENLQHTALIGSPLHLRQIMLNLFSNAIKYNRQSGTIDTYAKELSCDGETVWFEFKIVDTGIGMSEQFVKDELFKPFTQEQTGARTRYKGTGLGMSIVGKLVEIMGGTIEATSAKGEGSTFVFRIPFQMNPEGSIEAEQKNKGMEKELRLKGYHVLLVEDNEINMEIAQFYLEENGAEVELAWNGQEAVDKIKTSDPGAFDVILMDIMMPVLDGVEATHQIRLWEKQYDVHTPIIAMTAQASSDSVRMCREAGMDDYITKPVEPDLLTSRIVNQRREIRLT